MLPLRKPNSNRPVPPWLRYWQAHFRKAVETAGSLFEYLLPKLIHGVTVNSKSYSLFWLSALAASTSKRSNLGDAYIGVVGLGVVIDTADVTPAQNCRNWV